LIGNFSQNGGTEISGKLATNAKQQLCGKDISCAVHQTTEDNDHLIALPIIKLDLLDGNGVVNRL